ncbi:MAG: C45 family autoproteolytic acyltransferase/hydrolase [Halanaerobiales bacterium]
MIKKFIYLTLIVFLIFLIACSNDGVNNIIDEETRYTLNINIDGDGTGTVDPLEGEYAAETTVTIKVNPAEDSYFERWAGAHGNDARYKDGKWKILMDSDKDLTAIFALNTNKVVMIEEKDGYYMVNLNYDSGLSHEDIGRIYGMEIVEKVEGFEEKIDQYLLYLTQYGISEQTMFAGVENIKSNVNSAYIDEINGIASYLSGDVDQLGDGKLSYNELLMFNFFGDIFAMDSCSAVSVYGERSKDSSTIVGRNLDWFVGLNDEITGLQAVKKYNNNDHSIVSIATLGYMGVITGFNNDQVFGAHLISSTNQDFFGLNTRSYAMDLRYALENGNNMEEVADYINNDNYSVSHLVYLADSEDSKVLENYTGDSEVNQLRTSNSSIRADWDISDSIAAVNAFMLPDNPDNFSTSSGNTARWNSIIEQLSAKGDNVSFEDVKDVITYYSGNTPGSHADGDLYSINGYNVTTQTIVFKPETYELEVFFKPIGDLPVNPYFEKIDISFD